MSRERRHRDLRERLRAWDPLREHPLSPERSQRMRERLAETLDPAVPLARDRSWWSSLVWEPRWLAIAAGAVLVVAGALWWLQRDDPSGPLPAPSPQIAEAPSDGTAARAPAPGPEEATTAGPAAERAAAQQPAISPETETAQPAAAITQVAATAAPLVAAPAEPRPARRLSRPARRLQFRSPRGTRIFWTLDPDFDGSFATGAGE